MWKRLKAWVVWHLAQKEIQELYRWRLTHYEYSRWLAEMPQVSLTLRNMECVVRGNALDACHPPGPDGPWGVWGLRERLRMLTPNDMVSGGGTPSNARR